MQIIVSGTFRSGSSTIYNTIKDGLNDNTVIKKIHIGGLNNGLFQNNIIIIPIRNNKEVYVSGYMQDIYCPAYPYSIFNNCIKKWNKDKNLEYFKQKYNEEIDLDMIYENFKKQNMNKYIDFKVEEILNIFKPIGKICFQKGWYKITYFKKFNCKLCIVDFKMLNNIYLFKVMLNELGINSNPTKMIISNVSSDHNYLKLKDKLKENNYFDKDYYDFLNNSNYIVYI